MRRHCIRCPQRRIIAVVEDEVAVVLHDEAERLTTAADGRVRRPRRRARCRVDHHVSVALHGRTVPIRCRPARPHCGRAVADDQTPAAPKGCREAPTRARQRLPRKDALLTTEGRRRRPLPRHLAPKRPRARARNVVHAEWNRVSARLVPLPIVWLPRRPR